MKYFRPLFALLAIAAAIGCDERKVAKTEPILPPPAKQSVPDLSTDQESDRTPDPAPNIFTQASPSARPKGQTRAPIPRVALPVDPPVATFEKPTAADAEIRLKTVREKRLSALKLSPEYQKAQKAADDLHVKLERSRASGSMEGRLELSSAYSKALAALKQLEKAVDQDAEVVAASAALVRARVEAESGRIQSAASTDGSSVFDGSSSSSGASNAGGVTGGPKDVHVNGYTRKDGSHVNGYDRASPGNGGSHASSHK